MKLSTLLLATTFLAILLTVSCVPDDDPPGPQIEGLQIPSSPFSTFLNDPPFQLPLEGLDFVNETTTESGQGLFTGYYDLTTTSDTVFFTVDPNEVTWTSSDIRVVSVDAGLVTLVGEGAAEVTASLGDIVSNAIPITVSRELEAPTLVVDPPLRQLVFAESASITGIVSLGADLFIASEQSTYDATGRFARVMEGFQLGENTVEVIAQNPEDPSLDARASKLFIYEFPDENASIVGLWNGTTQGLDFNFEVAYNADSMRYDLLGTIAIEFLNFGLVEGIRIRGIVNPDGSIDANLSLDEAAVEVGGTFDGFFSDMGTAEGSYAAGLEVGGFDTGDASFDWSAVKVD